MTAREAAARLGGQATSSTTLICPGPGHRPHDRSLSVRFDPAAPDGFLVHSFAGDEPIVCRDHVRAALGLGFGHRRGDHIPGPRLRPAPLAEASNSLAALRIWGEALDARGTLAETYLFGRGLELDDRAREAVRFHPALRFDNGTTPAMVGAPARSRSDEPCGVHRTFLDRDGRKLERRMLGRARGAAVKLDPDDTVELGLVVGEGIETCLAARQLGYRPCWALGSAQAIAKLPVLGGVEGLTILGDGSPPVSTSACSNPSAAPTPTTCCGRWHDERGRFPREAVHRGRFRGRTGVLR